MKLIPLTQGKFAQVDDWWFYELTQFKWYAHKSADSATFYARRNITISPNKQITIFMHNIIMATPDGLEVDHIDHNGLNCLEENMRNCTHLQNMMNHISVGKSPYLGVSYHKGTLIRATIKLSGKCKHLGYFKTEEDAARAYDKKAKELFGEFANLNFK